MRRAAKSAMVRTGKRRGPGPEGEMATEVRNVLIVEDDPTLSALVARVLSGAGYRPVTIADHSLIDSAVARWDPRCVILDGEVRASGEPHLG